MGGFGLSVFGEQLCSLGTCAAGGVCSGLKFGAWVQDNTPRFWWGAFEGDRRRPLQWDI